jgi:PKHD-type hydroxylase
MSWLFEQDKLENWAYWDNVFTSQECENIIELALKKEKKEATIGENNIDSNYRKSKIIWLSTLDNINWIYERLTFFSLELNKQYFNFQLNGFIEPLQFTEYKSPSSHYDYHNDRRFNSIPRKLSIVIQLTNPNDYKGCDLELLYNKDPIIAKKDQGSLIAFPSYTMHKVTPITKGTRHSLVAWINGKSFK